MKDQSKKSSTSGLNRKTGALEQLPSSQKRNLRTGQLASTHTEHLSEPPNAPENARPAESPAPPPVNPPPANPPVVNAPVVNVKAPEQPSESSARKTSVIEAASRTTNHLVMKPPVEEPVKPVVSEPVRPPQPVSVKPVAEPPMMSAPVEKSPIQQTAEMRVREIKSIDALEAKASQDAKAAEPVAAPVKPAVEAQKAEIKPPVVKAVVPQVTAATEAVDQAILANISAANSNDARTQKIASVDDLPLFGKLETFSEPPPPPRTAGSIAKSIVLWSIPFIVLIGTALAIVLNVPALREKLRDNLPVKVASLIGVKPNLGPQVSVQADPVIYDEKEKTATLGGVVTNISDAPIGPIQVEFTLAHREDARKVETKVLTVEPSQIAVKATGKYQFTIAAKDFQEIKLARVLNGQVALKFKNLGVAEPQPQPEVQPASTATANPAANKPKPPDNAVYEGSVTFK